jgi:hypothetical protein
VSGTRAIEKAARFVGEATGCLCQCGSSVSLPCKHCEFIAASVVEIYTPEEMVMRRREWQWKPRGWFVLLTIGGPWGLGFMAHGLRFNGVDVYFGPAVLTIQPPMPCAAPAGTCGAPTEKDR